MTNAHTFSLQSLMHLLSVLLLLLVTTGAQAETAAERVRVVTEDLYPLSYIDPESGAVVGVATDMIRTVLDETGLDYEIELIQWPDAYAAAINTPNTLIFSMARIAEREEKFVWLHKIADFQYGLYTTDPNEIGATLDDVKQAYVSITRGDFSSFILKDLGFENLIYINENERTEDLLAKDQIDLVFSHELWVLQNSARFPVPVYRLDQIDIPMTDTGLYFAINPRTPRTVIERIQRSFATQIQADTYANLLVPYLPAAAAGSQDISAN